MQPSWRIDSLRAAPHVAGTVARNSVCHGPRHAPAMPDATSSAQMRPPTEPGLLCSFVDRVAPYSRPSRSVQYDAWSAMQDMPYSLTGCLRRTCVETMYRFPFARVT